MCGLITLSGKTRDLLRSHGTASRMSEWKTLSNGLVACCVMGARESLEQLTCSLSLQNIRLLAALQLSAEPESESTSGAQWQLLHHVYARQQLSHHVNY